MSTSSINFYCVLCALAIDLPLIQHLKGKAMETKSSLFTRELEPREKVLLDPELKQTLAKVANTIRGLSMDAVQKADSGHPGLPMGCAEIGAYLFGHWLNYNPKDPKWINRDRFILSAGHGSMLLYSCLHLSGYPLTLDDLKNFRQWHSKTPGHPESLDTEGVETTTGPLGQGAGVSVGQALGLKILAAKFNTEKHQIFTNKVIALVSDGDIMEGVCSEASSLAGHLKLDNLIFLYDSNKITLDGPMSESCSEDTKARYKAYGWDVYEIDGKDLDALEDTLSHLRKTQTKPCFVVTHTVIGQGSPNKAGTHKAHGSPLGPDEVKASKEALGIPLDDFYVPQGVKSFFEKKLEQDAVKEKEWRRTFDSWVKENPEKFQEFTAMQQQTLPQDLEAKLQALEIKSPVAGRKASQDVLNLLADLLPYLIGGSADLSGSDLTMIKKFPLIAPGVFSGRNIKFGVREFGMSTIATGISQTGFFLPFIGTFLTFSDYMRNAIRLAALQRAHVVYQFTHDSIFLGEDGPTHQPIEHYAALRAMPNLQVIRPADSHEVKGAWIAALRYKGPTAIILSRQNLPELAETNVPYAEGVGRGGYIIKREKSKPNFTLFATGSEVSLALNVASELEKRGKSVRVVSLPCWELFDEQPKDYRQSVAGGDLGMRVSIEAGTEFGWHKFIGLDGIAISIDHFGASAPASVLAKEFGFNVDAILERLLAQKG
jgi:transketolase